MSTQPIIEFEEPTIEEYMQPNKYKILDQTKEKVLEAKTRQQVQLEKPLQAYTPNTIGPSIPKQYELNKEYEDKDDQEPITIPKDYIHPDIHAKLPIKYETVLHHKKMVASLDIDKIGNRMATGGFDYKVNMWELYTITSDLKPFRSFEPYELQPVFTVSFSPKAKFALIIGGRCTAKIYNREGVYEQETLKGDMYIRDMTYTKGHTQGIRDGQWHPLEENYFMTCGEDGTVRLWDLQARFLGLGQHYSQAFLIKMKGKNVHKLAATACTYSRDGMLCGAAGIDGSLQFWDATKVYFPSPDIYIENAHPPEKDVTSMCFMNDSLHVCTRAMDNTVKIWDLRMASHPLRELVNLPNNQLKTQVTMSHDGKYILTGTSVDEQNPLGFLYMYDSTTFDIKARIATSSSSVIRMLWHDKINEIVTTHGDGTVKIMFDPKLSTKAIINGMLIKKKEAAVDDIEYLGTVLTPHTMPTFRENSKKRLNELIKAGGKLKDAPKVIKPDKPLEGPMGKNGQLSISGTITKMILTKIQNIKQPTEDPREEVIKFKEIAEKNPEWVAPAYQQTQPKPIYNYQETTVEELKFMESTKRKKCPKCGLKFCNCDKPF